MKKIFFLTALLCASMMSWGIDWSSYDWIGDGAGGGAYSNKYKIALAEGQAVVNIQEPGFASKPGIYTTVPAGVSSCSLGEGNYAVQGAGIVLYLDAFTEQETEVTIVHGLGNCVCTVYYAEGTLPGDDYTITITQPLSGGTIAANKTEAKAGAIVTLTATPNSGKKLEAWIVKDSEDVDVTVTNNQFTMPHSDVTITATFIDKPVLTPATYWGEDQFTHNDVNYPVLWSITRNENSSLTYSIEMSQTPDGFVPQVNHNGFHEMSSTGSGKWSYTDSEEHEGGATVTGEFYFAYANGASSVQWTGYTVGASNTKPGPATAITNTEVEAKAVKVFENGQLIIIKNGVKYNALGTQL